MIYSEKVKRQMIKQGYLLYKDSANNEVFVNATAAENKNVLEVIHTEGIASCKKEVILNSRAKSGLVIKYPWTDLILSGKKHLEIRGSDTKTRGRIFLIQSGTGLILGEASLTNSIKLSDCDFALTKNAHCIEIPFKDLKYDKESVFGWKLEHAIRYHIAIPYEHPQGAVVWVRNAKDRIIL